MSVDRKMAGKEAKKKALIAQQRLRLEDLEEQEELDNMRLMGEIEDNAVNSGDDSDDKMYKEANAGKDIEDSGDSDADNACGTKACLFVNPLAKKNLKADESEEWSDDDLSDGGRKKKKVKKDKKDTVLGKRKRKGSMDDIKDFFKNETIEEVPANDPGTLAH